MILFILMCIIQTVSSEICLRNQHVSGGACVTCPFPQTSPSGLDTNNGDTTCASRTVADLPDCGITLPASGQTSEITLTQDCKSGELIFHNTNDGTLIINGGGHSIVASGTNHRFIRNYDQDSDGTEADEAHIKLNNVNIDGFRIGTSNEYGGAFKIRNTWLEAKSCSFTRNHAEWRGGVVRSEFSTLIYIEDCEFVGNRIGSSTSSSGRGGLISASTSSARLIMRSSQIKDTKRDSGQDDYIDCKDTEHCVLDEITADATFAEQNIDLKSDMACPVGENFDVGSKFSSDVGTDYNFCKADETCTTVNTFLIRCQGQQAPSPAGQQAPSPATQPSTCDLCQGTCNGTECICEIGTAGTNCELDVTAAGIQRFFMSLRKSLPTDAELREMHKKLKQFILDSGMDIRFSLELRDLLTHQRAIVAKTEKQAELDACLDCIVDISDKVTFVHTDTWTILRDTNYITRQTKISDTEYDMECWMDGWYNTTRFDIHQREKLYECNGYVILVGSQAVVCTPSMCTCEADDLTYTCKEDIQASTCHDIDCSDFGGHKKVECTDCTHTECCNFATRKDFNLHCESLDAQGFVEQQCCLRDTC